MTMLDVLTANSAKNHGDGKYTISSENTVNPWNIHVLKDAIYPETGSVWDWKVDGQLFSRDEWAAAYLVKLIAEKITGERIIDRERGKVPDICGCEEYVSKYSCRAKQRGYFTMLCSYCPIAEQMEADRDGVKLIYLSTQPNIPLVS